MDTVVDGIQTDLSNATDGLGALKALIDAVDTVADAIKAKTDNLPTDPADESLLEAAIADLISRAKGLDEIYDGVGTVDTVVDGINSKVAEVHDVVIYPGAEDRATTELTGDGTSPNYLAESSQSNIDEAAGMASPAWTEDIDFEQAGTIAVISIYAELRWAQKQTGGGTSSAKMQISADDGATWIDLTDNVTETGTSYADKARAGVGRWITAITAGTNQLQLRLCQWGGTTSSQVKLREDSYLRIAYRKV